MVKIDASSQATVGNIEIKKSKNIFSKHNHYTVTIEGIKHHYVDKPADSRDASTTGLNFTPIKLSGDNINNAALIFSKMCEENKTYKPVEFIRTMIENQKFCDAFAILNHKQLSKRNADSIVCRLGNDIAAEMLDNVGISEAITFLKFLTNPEYILDQMTFEQLNYNSNPAVIHEVVNILDEKQNYPDDLAGKIIEKMFDSDAFKTANIVSLVSDSKAAAILANIPDETAAKLIETMATYKPSDPYNNPDVFLSMDKAIVILSDKNLPAEKAATIIKNLPDDVAAEIFARLPQDIRKKIYDNIANPAIQLRLLKKCNPKAS